MLSVSVIRDAVAVSYNTSLIFFVMTGRPDRRGFQIISQELIENNGDSCKFTIFY